MNKITRLILLFAIAINFTAFSQAVTDKWTTGIKFKNLDYGKPSHIVGATSQSVLFIGRSLNNKDNIKKRKLVSLDAKTMKVKKVMKILGGDKSRKKVLSDLYLSQDFFMNGKLYLVWQNEGTYSKKVYVECFDENLKQVFLPQLVIDDKTILKGKNDPLEYGLAEVIAKGDRFFVVYEYLTTNNQEYNIGCAALDAKMKASKPVSIATDIQKSFILDKKSESHLQIDDNNVMYANINVKLEKDGKTSYKSLMFWLDPINGTSNKDLIEEGNLYATQSVFLDGKYVLLGLMSGNDSNKKYGYFHAEWKKDRGGLVKKTFVPFSPDKQQQMTIEGLAGLRILQHSATSKNDFMVAGTEKLVYSQTVTSTNSSGGSSSYTNFYDAYSNIHLYDVSKGDLNFHTVIHRMNVPEQEMDDRVAILTSEDKFILFYPTTGQYNHIHEKLEGKRLKTLSEIECFYSTVDRKTGAHTLVLNKEDNKGGMNNKKSGQFRGIYAADNKVITYHTYKFGGWKGITTTAVQLATFPLTGFTYIIRRTKPSISTFTYGGFTEYTVPGTKHQMINQLNH